MQMHRRHSKKTLADALATVAHDHPPARLELWAMDEHRIGLKPIIRRVWRRRGQRPLVTVQHRYKWTYLYGFVCPESGQTFWLLLPSVSILLYNAALAEFAKFVGAGRDKRVVLVLDQAGWHSSERVIVPEGLHLEFLPAYSPELQPAEHLWEVSDEVLVNQHFQDLDELLNVQAKQCRALQQRAEMISSRTNFHWWPKVPLYSSV
jgi:transposase